MVSEGKTLASDQCGRGLRQGFGVEGRHGGGTRVQERGIRVKAKK